MGKLKINDFNSSNSDDDEAKLEKDKTNDQNKSRNQITVQNKLNFKRSQSSVEIPSRAKNRQFLSL